MDYPDHPTPPLYIPSIMPTNATSQSSTAWDYLGCKTVADYYIRDAELKEKRAARSRK